MSHETFFPVMLKDAGFEDVIDEDIIDQVTLIHVHVQIYISLCDMLILTYSIYIFSVCQVLRRALEEMEKEKEEFNHLRLLRSQKT